MGKEKKGTKQFKKKHLEAVLAKRKVVKKIKQKDAARLQQKQAKAAERKEPEEEHASSEEESVEDHKQKQQKQNGKSKKNLADMNVEELMEGDFFDWDEDDSKADADDDDDDTAAAGEDEDEDEEDQDAEALQDYEEDDEEEGASEGEEEEQKQKQSKRKATEKKSQPAAAGTRAGAAGAAGAGKAPVSAEEQARLLQEVKRVSSVEDLTLAHFRALRRHIASNPTLNATKTLLKLFRSACHVHDAANADAAAAADEGGNDKKKQKKQQKLQQQVRLSSTRVYSLLMQFALKFIPRILLRPLQAEQRRSGGAGGAGGKSHKKSNSKKKNDDDEEEDDDDDDEEEEDAAASPSSGSGSGGLGGLQQQLSASVFKSVLWRRVEPLAKVFLSGVVHLLSLQVGVEPRLLALALRALSDAAMLLTAPAFAAPPASSSGGGGGATKHLAHKALKALLRVWAASESERGVRLEAFLVLRTLALAMPLSSLFLEAALKGAYLTYVRNAKFVTLGTDASIVFAANCVAELYGIDPLASYQHAFVYIRQLAIHLRTAIAKKDKEAVKSVYNWQFVNCLRVWAQILAAHSGGAGAGAAGAAGEGTGSSSSSSSSPLAQLIYPFCQICLGVLELQQSAVYFPLRFVVAGFVNTLCEKTRVYVPLAPHLLSVFEAAEMKQRPRAASKKQSELKFKLHVSKSVLATKTFQEFVAANAVLALSHHFAVFAHSVAFPELILTTRIFLRKYFKASRLPSATKQTKDLVHALEQTAAALVQLRSAAQDLAPCEMMLKGISGVDSLALPTPPPQQASSSSSSEADGAAAAGKKKKGGAASAGHKPLPIEVFYQQRRAEALEQEEIVLAGRGMVGKNHENKKKRRAGEEEEEDDEEEEDGEGAGESDDDDDDDDEGGVSKMEDDDDEDEDEDASADDDEDEEEGGSYGAGDDEDEDDEDFKGMQVEVAEDEED